MLTGNVQVGAGTAAGGFGRNSLVRTNHGEKFKISTHDYMTSLGPWEEDTVIEYLADEYPELSSHPQEQVNAFIADTQEARVLTFAA
jgi:hypothetical protein